MIIYAIFFTLGYFTYPIIKSIQNSIFFDETSENYKEATKKIEEVEELVKNKEFNLEPKYVGYKGKYDLITKCEGCGMIALYEDQNPNKPCNFCDGNVVPHGAAKWMEIDGEYQWNKNGKKMATYKKKYNKAKIGKDYLNDELDKLLFENRRMTKIISMDKSIIAKDNKRLKTENDDLKEKIQEYNALVKTITEFKEHIIKQRYIINDLEQTIKELEIILNERK